MNRREEERAAKRRARPASAELRLRLTPAARRRLIEDAAAAGRTVTDHVLARCLGEGARG